jgi:hypothetical protein
MLMRLPCMLQAVKDDWYFQMYYDDLPVWGFIGKVEKIILKSGVAEYRYYVFTHVDFDIKYQGDRVIEINVLTDPHQAVDISEGQNDVKAKFSYSVKWTPTTITFENRLQRYERFPLNPVHLEVGRTCIVAGWCSRGRPTACHGWVVCQDVHSGCATVTALPPHAWLQLQSFIM